MWTNKFKRVLALSPHTDDIEFGCGATLANLLTTGVRVKSIAFSAAEESVPEGLPIDTLRKEFAISHDLLGIPIEDREVLMFKVRHFPRDRQEILEVLVQLNLSYQPDLVLVPSTGDTHQDHKTIAEEAFRAFKRTSMWAYEVPWNQQVSKVNCFVGVSEVELQKKITAIEAYESQKHRKYTTNQFIRSLAVVRGGQMGVPLAEGFEVVRQMVF